MFLQHVWLVNYSHLNGHIWSMCLCAYAVSGYLAAAVALCVSKHEVIKKLCHIFILLLLSAVISSIITIHTMRLSSLCSTDDAEHDLFFSSPYFSLPTICPKTLIWHLGRVFYFVLFIFHLLLFSSKSCLPFLFLNVTNGLHLENPLYDEGDCLKMIHLPSVFFACLCQWKILQLSKALQY